MPDDEKNNADDFDASIFKVLLDGGEAMAKAGVPEDEAVRHVSDALQAGLDAATPNIVAELIKGS